MSSNVFIGLPTHASSLSMVTHQTLQVARSPGLNIKERLQGYSLLCYNFSSLWGEAYIRNADYFLLFHSDIGLQLRPPEKPYSWLAGMINTMKSEKLAALACVPVIKSMDGHTSTGLQLEKTNSFRIRRLTTSELVKLPMVFGRDEVVKLFGADPDTAGALYINTGCLLFDLKNFPWAAARFPGFCVNTKIGWSRDGVPKTFTLPEDWGFSQWLTKQGWPYKCTREFIANHTGTHTWAAEPPYGVPVDIAGPENVSFVDYEATFLGSARGGKNLIIRDTP